MNNFGVELDWGFIFQILNILVLIGIIYAIYTFSVAIPRRFRMNEKRIEDIEKMIKEINQK